MPPCAPATAPTKSSGAPVLFAAPAACALPPNVRAGFTARAGGVGAPPFAGLNLSLRVGDSPRAVAENRRLLRARLPASPAWLHQTHGARVVCADEVLPDKTQADAAHTQTPGVVCAALTADCVPVLLWNKDGRAVAAAHAGWRGIAAGVLQNAARALPPPVAAVIGPCISPVHYEVGEETRAALQQSPADADAFAPAATAGKWRANLRLLAANRLKEAGCRAHIMRRCAFGEKKNGEFVFFSARRAAAAPTGRQAALIYIAAPARGV